MEVRVSGPVLASLFLELANGKGDLEGFLLGDTSGKTVNAISDSSSQHLRYERIATIQGFIPRNRVFSFYDNVGCIDKKKLEMLLGQNKENVIGWYKYRRNTQPIVSMRERHVHHNLIKEINYSPPKEFLFIAFTASMSAVMSVHSFNYSIVSSRHLASPFDSHDLKVVNLGDTCHSEYRLKPETIRTPSKVFQDVTNAYREDFIDKDGCLQQPLATHSMCISLMSKMKDILKEVNNSESTVGVMSEQVEILKEKLEKKKKEKDLKLEKKRLLEEKEVKTAPLIEISKEVNTVKQEKPVGEVKREQGLKPKHRHSSKSSSHSHKREVEPMDTSASCDLIDFGNDSKMKAGENQQALNGGIDYKNIKKELSPSQMFDIDDDETQDFSLPDDNCSQAVSSLKEKTLPESMSPTY